MHSPFETVTDLDSGADRLRARRYGVIESSGGRLVRVTLRPWPHLVSWPELMPVARDWRPGGPADRCRLYYNQPCGHGQFLALKYVACTQGTSYSTFRAALAVLDRVAEIKGSRAILCDAANARLSERFMRRMGWSPHAPRWGHRNFIKRMSTQQSAFSYQPKVSATPVAKELTAEC